MVLRRDEDRDLMVSSGGQVYVPPIDNLRLRVRVTAHAGSSGHRGQAVTQRLVCDRFCWEGASSDVAKMVSKCLHCTPSRGAASVPRPLAETAHAKGINEMIHFDFTFIQGVDDDASHQFHSVMVIKDDFSGFVSFTPVERTTAEAAASALLSWFAAYGVVDMWVSDSGSHFINAVMEDVRTRLRCAHHVTAPYAPWSNGTVERVNSELLFTLRSMCSEYRLDFSEWPRLLPVVQAAINAVPSRRLGGRCPHEVFTGRAPVRPVDVILRGPTEVQQIDVSEATVASAVRALASSLECMHKRVSDIAAQRPRSRHPQRAVEQQPSFSVGDYVLVSRIVSTRRSKLQSVYYGPCVVKGYVPNSGHLVYLIKDLVHGGESRVHSRRLRFYSDRHLDVTVEMRDIIAAASPHGRNDEYYPERIVSHRQRGGVWEFEVVWLGFERSDTTFENGDELCVSADVLLKQYIRGLPASSPHKTELLVTYGRA